VHYPPDDTLDHLPPFHRGVPIWRAGKLIDFRKLDRCFSVIADRMIAVSSVVRSLGVVTLMSRLPDAVTGPDRVSKMSNDELQRELEH
jgi:hypothetical protein